LKPEGIEQGDKDISQITDKSMEIEPASVEKRDQTN